MDVAREDFARVELAITRFGITIGRARLVEGAVVARDLKGGTESQGKK